MEINIKKNLERAYLTWPEEELNSLLNDFISMHNRIKSLPEIEKINQELKFCKLDKDEINPLINNLINNLNSSNNKIII